MDEGWIRALIAAGASIVAALVASVTTFIVQRKPALVTAEAMAQTSVNNGFAELAKSLMGELNSARDEIKQLRGELADMTQHLYSLETILRQEGLPIPVRVRPAVFTVATKQ